MIQSEPATQLNQILLQDADSVLAWLKNIFSADSSPPEGFNWLGLAEAAAFNAHEGKRHDSTAPDIKWAEVATTVYDRLAALADKVCFRTRNQGLAFLAGKTAVEALHLT
jgi:hypothetical protein